MSRADKISNELFFEFICEISVGNLEEAKNILLEYKDSELFTGFKPFEVFPHDRCFNGGYSQFATMMRIVSIGRIDVLEILLELGMNVNATDGYYTILDYAIEIDNEPCKDFLKKKGGISVKLILDMIEANLSKGYKEAKKDVMKTLNKFKEMVHKDHKQYIVDVLACINSKLWLDSQRAFAIELEERGCKEAKEVFDSMSVHVENRIIPFIDFAFNFLEKSFEYRSSIVGDTPMQASIKNDNIFCYTIFQNYGAEIPKKIDGKDLATYLKNDCEEVKEHILDSYPPTLLPLAEKLQQEELYSYFSLTDSMFNYGVECSGEITPLPPSDSGFLHPY